MLQTKDFTLSDFYGSLQVMDMQLNKKKSASGQYTKLAEHLHGCLNKRKKELIANPLMRCAMFLDPRYKCDIDCNHELVIFVKLTLENMWQRIRSIKNDGRTDEMESENRNSNKTSDDLCMNDLYAELDAEYAKRTECNSHNLSPSRPDFSKSKSDIAEAIYKYDEFVSGTRMKSSDSIHAFWEKNKSKFGLELYEIASTIFAIPPTQSAVERYFSALKYLFSVYRYNLAEDLLESCLLIHLNPDFFNIVKEKNVARVIDQNQKA